MDDTVNDGIEEDDLASFNENLNQDPVRKQHNKFIRYAALAVLIISLIVLGLQVLDRLSQKGINLVFGFEMDIVGAVSLVAAFVVVYTYRE